MPEFSPPAKIRRISSAVLPTQAVAPMPEKTREFTRKATIPTFRQDWIKFPANVKDYNDEMKLAAYMPADLSFDGKHRKGVHEISDSCSRFPEHIRTAIRGKFPLSYETPPPREANDASVFLRDAIPAELASFWESKLAKLTALLADSEGAQMKWGSRITPDLISSTGKLKTVALSHRFRRYGLGGQRWLRQFANGFPITGQLSQRSVVPLSDKRPSLLRRSELIRSAEARFRERASQSGTKDAQTLWNEAVRQVRKGWLSPPIPPSRGRKARSMEDASI